MNEWPGQLRGTFCAVVVPLVSVLPRTVFVVPGAFCEALALPMPRSAISMRSRLPCESASVAPCRWTMPETDN